MNRCDDIRIMAASVLIEELEKRGYTVTKQEPRVPSVPTMVTKYDMTGAAPNHTYEKTVELVTRHGKDGYLEFYPRTGKVDGT